MELFDFEEIKNKVNRTKWYGTEAWYDILEAIGDCENKSRPHGEWIEKVERRGCFAGDKTVYSYTCPFCGVKEFKKYPFCHCGADMRKGFRNGERRMELIEVEELKQFIKKEICAISSKGELLVARNNIWEDAFDFIPIIENKPEGVWVGIDEEPHEEWECDNCGNIINTYLQDELEEHKYCHKCGAKMSTPWIDMRGEQDG